MAETAEGTAEPGVGSATEPADEPAAEPAENATGEAGEAAAADAPGEENPRRSYMIEPSAQTDEAATLEPVNDYRVFAIVLLVFCSVSCCCARIKYHGITRRYVYISIGIYYYFFL